MNKKTKPLDESTLSIEDLKAGLQDMGSDVQEDYEEEALVEPIIETPEDNTRAYLMDQAKVLGLNVPINIPTSRLIKLISDKKDATAHLSVSSAIKAGSLKDDMNALVRIRLTVLNPKKQSWSGEVFSVGNDVIPTITRYIPFNAVDGIWHVERMFVEFIKSKKYQHIPQHSNNNNAKNYGVDYSKSKLLPDFHIEILPSLTVEELAELAKRQAVNGSIEED